MRQQIHAKFPPTFNAEANTNFQSIRFFMFFFLNPKNLGEPALILASVFSSMKSMLEEPLYFTLSALEERGVYTYKHKRMSNSTIN